MRLNFNRKDTERIIYIILIVGLAIYGLKDSEAAERLIRSVSEAFTILINSP